MKYMLNVAFSYLKQRLELGMVVCACNPSTREEVGGGSEIQSLPWVHETWSHKTSYN